MNVFKLPFSKKDIEKACMSDREAERRKDEATINEILKRNRHLKIDISEVEDITLQISPAYREDIVIFKTAGRVEICKEYCVPNGPDDIASELETLKVFDV